MGLTAHKADHPLVNALDISLPFFLEYHKWQPSEKGSSLNITSGIEPSEKGSFLNITSGIEPSMKGTVCAS